MLDPFAQWPRETRQAIELRWREHDQVAKTSEHGAGVQVLQETALEATPLVLALELVPPVVRQSQECKGLAAEPPYRR